MTHKLRWTDLQADSFNITKIDNLMPQEGNYHQYNHKLLYTIVINLIRIKIILSVLRSSIQITNYGTNQLLQLIKPHRQGYQLLVLRYKRFLTGTQIVMGVLSTCTISLNCKLSKNCNKPVYSLHLYVNIPQAGIDLNTYPTNWTKEKCHQLIHKKLTITTQRLILSQQRLFTMLIWI